MRSIKNIGNYPAGIPLAADHIMEFHASRLILLLNLVGDKGEIKGLTKLAKLDFFVRYSGLFARVKEHLEGKSLDRNSSIVESSMIRYKYGPWDPRYYHVLSYLESKNILKVNQNSPKTFSFSLTSRGKLVADRLEKEPSFFELRSQMVEVKKVLGKMTGSGLKKLIYDLFDDEVASLNYGDVIENE